MQRHGYLENLPRLPREGNTNFANIAAKESVLYNSVVLKLMRQRTNSFFFGVSASTSIAAQGWVPHETSFYQHEYSKFSRHFGHYENDLAETGRRPLFIRAKEISLVLASLVFAVAADLDFFTSSSLAVVAAELFAFRDQALAGLMRALSSFVVSHFALFLSVECAALAAFSRWFAAGEAGG
jgi:hypothetical protein